MMSAGPSFRERPKTLETPSIDAFSPAAVYRSINQCRDSISASLRAGRTTPVSTAPKVRSLRKSPSKRSALIFGMYGSPVTVPDVRQMHKISKDGHPRQSCGAYAANIPAAGFGDMHAAAVIPEHQVVQSPFMAVHERRLNAVFGQFRKQGFAFNFLDSRVCVRCGPG